MLLHNPLLVPHAILKVGTTPALEPPNGLFSPTLLYLNVFGLLREPALVELKDRLKGILRLYNRPVISCLL